MIVWILNVGENMPTDGDGTRIFRCGLLADELQKRGHEVVWWSSTFDHYNKQQRYDSDHTISLNDHYTIKFLKGFGYRSNVSLRRIADHFILGQKFLRQIPKMKQPDIIISSFPIISFTYLAVKYGKKNKIPVVVDARDMWPDIFLDALPRILRPFGKIALYPFFHLTHYAFKHAFAITGMTEGFVKWAIRKSKRQANDFDVSFPFGYDKKTFSDELLKKAEDFWKEKKVTSQDHIIAIISNITGVFDVDLVVASARLAKKKNIKLKIVVCGTGENFSELQEKSKDLDNIVLAGWVEGAEIQVLLKLSKAGWIPYQNRKDFLMSIPNKVPEYMSQGLPVITSLHGVVKELVEQNNCGYFIQSEKDFCDVIQTMSHDKKEYEAQKINSLHYFSENFESQKVYRDMANYLEQIAQQKNKI